MKKLLIGLILIMSMLLSSVSGIYASSIPDLNGAGEKAANFVTAAGFMELSENGNFEADKSVTRAEFCKMVYKLFNMNTSLTENHFRDVYDDTPEIKEINALFEMGILSGVGDNRFAPDKEISFTESIKIILDLMGYKSYCLVRGGYPTGYLLTGKQVDLIKDSDTGTTKGCIAKLLYNASLCEIPEIESMNSDGNMSIVTKGTTLLEEYHDIYFEKGIVNANHLFNIDGKGELDYGKIRINNMVVELGDDKYRLYDSVGYYTEIFYHYNEDSDKRTLVYGFKDTERSREEIIETDDFTNYSSYTIYYGDNDKFSFDSSAVVVRNNELLENYSKDDFKNAYGKIICTSYNGLSVIRIIDMDIYVVNFTSPEEKKVYNKYKPEISFDLSENGANERYSLHDAYGRTETFESIMPGDVLCVAEGNGFLDITRITEKKTYTITAIGGDKYYFDGGYFELSEDILTAIASGRETAPCVGESIQIVFDLYGKAAGFFERNKSGERLVYLINAARPKSSLSDSYEFLFLSSSGEKLILKSNDKVTYTVGNYTDKISANALYNNLLDGSDIKRQVAYIKTNAENELIYFEGASDEASWVDGKLSQKSVSGNYKKQPMSIEGKASGNAETIVFAYPPDESDRTNTDKYGVFSLSTLQNSDTFSATVYQRDMNKIPVVAMAVMQNNVSTVPASLFIVDEITRVINEENSETIEITGYENGSFSSIKLENESVLQTPVLTSGDSANFVLSKGDVIRYTKAANNYITGITVIYDYETSGNTLWSGGCYNKFTNIFYLVAGTAELVDGDYVKINKGITDGVHNGYEIQFIGDARVTVVDMTGREINIRPGSERDIIDARSGNPSFVIARCSSGICSEIIIYR